ncbi:thiamine kinase-like enzyme [Bacillus tianshenii]|uniref:Thiamine kinase-like enzyme n=1 Tax=Sutcliffiella tianshenii TaxID=1463404 RepID=A0ABS2NZ42_9BACI|nr:thiamine kinase-like enzyme [Bacillus tianshenii]
MIGSVSLSEKILKEHLMDKYGDFIPVRLSGGYTNETFLLKGTRPPLVAKVANSFNQDIQNEINCLTLNQETGVVPKVYDFIEAENFQISVMEYREGTNGQFILDNNDLERTKDLYKILGKSLSENIHSRKYNFNSNGIKECDLDTLNFNLDFVPESLIQFSKEILEKINDTKEEWVLTHGDYGMHNVLYATDNTITVLDWEWSEWANPLTDIGWVCWFTKLHYPEHASLLNSLFIKEYKSNSHVHLSSEKLKAYCVYKVWKVLNKVKDGPQEVLEEWVKRLKWTIETDVI